MHGTITWAIFFLYKGMLIYNIDLACYTYWRE